MQEMSELEYILPVLEYLRGCKEAGFKPDLSALQDSLDVVEIRRDMAISNNKPELAEALERAYDRLYELQRVCLEEADYEGHGRGWHNFEL